jgi:putative phosphoribosyl transferase
MTGSPGFTSFDPSMEITSTLPAYHDRNDAAIVLSERLQKFKGTNAIILAIPRGGVPIGCDLATDLQLPVEIALAKKIGHPSNPEYAVGAVTLEDAYFDEEAESISPGYLDKEAKKIKAELASRLRNFMPGKKLTSLRGKNVIIVDDGIATGRTLIACIRSVRKKKPAKLIVAAPVASSHAASVLSPLTDEFICPLISPEFYAVGQFYENFPQVSDEEVKLLLTKSGEGNRPIS